MNSLDPWSVIATDPAGNVILPPARYGHPFYRDVPSWPTCGDQGNRRFLFEGAFVGAETPVTEPLKRTGLTAAVAPVVAPATGGITVKKELDDKQILHVEICVDGKCYRQSMDLAPAIDMLLKKLAHWHESQHAAKAATLPAEAVVGCVDAAVGQVADSIVDDLIGCHCNTVCGSFLGDIAGAVKGAVHGAVHGVGSIAGGIGSTLKKLKGPIATAAAAAASAGAAAIPGVGPIAAPIAGQLAFSLVQSATGDNKAKQQVQQAQQQAKTDPTVALALAEAQKAVANATVAHHVQETAKQAASGHPAAQQQIAQVQADASQGDPAAQAVQAIIQNVQNALTSSAPVPATAAGQWFDVVGQSDPTTRALIQSAIRDARISAEGVRQNAGWGHRVPSHFLVWKLVNAPEEAGGPPWYANMNIFSTLGEALDYAQKINQSPAVVATAVFDSSSPHWPNPINWHKNNDPAHAAVIAQKIASGPYTQTAGWHDLVGATPSAAAEQVRARGKQLASSRPGAAVGAIHAVRDGHWHVYSFSSLDDAIDWLQHAAYDKSSFTYAAAYEKGNDGEAYIQAEEFGRPSSRPLVPGEALRRSITTSGRY